MSKIEICSTHPGATVSVTTKQGRKVNVEFEEKQGPNGPIGYAEVDEDVAERLLPIKKEYWKPGVDGAPKPLTKEAIEQALAADPVAREAAERLLGGRSPESVLAEIEELKAQLAEKGDKKEKPLTGLQKVNADKKANKSAIEAIKLAETAEEIDAVVGENENEDVLAAAAERKTQIEA